MIAAFDADHFHCNAYQSIAAINMQAFLNASRPLASAMIAHNGGNSALARLAALSPRARVVALAPHVAAAAKAAHGVAADWAMATLPFRPRDPCSVGPLDALGCLDGFAIQGNFEPQRRNYTRLWAALEARMRSEGGGNGNGTTLWRRLPADPRLPELRLHLLGRGHVEALGLPPAVAASAQVHFNADYPDYYEAIHRAHGLLLLLASDAYTSTKASSSVVASLVASTPVVADAATLRAYSFIPPGAAFALRKGEDEVGAMLRVRTGGALGRGRGGREELWERQRKGRESVRRRCGGLTMQPPFKHKAHQTCNRTPCRTHTHTDPRDAAGRGLRRPPPRRAPRGRAQRRRAAQTRGLDAGGGGDRRAALGGRQRPRHRRRRATACGLSRRRGVIKKSCGAPTLTALLAGVARPMYHSAPPPSYYFYRWRTRAAHCGAAAVLDCHTVPSVVATWPY